MTYRMTSHFEVASMKTKEVGRLAMRVEGDFWVAYYAMPHTMEGAIPLASIRMGATKNQERKDAFFELAKGIVADLLKETIGHQPTWDNLRSAPESERSGNA
jgi:hypothetical protein